MASGWKVWVWLECIGDVWLVGVAVRRYIDILIIIITFPYTPLVYINSFFGSSFFVHFLFFHSCLCYFCAI